MRRSPGSRRRPVYAYKQRQALLPRNLPFSPVHPPTQEQKKRGSAGAPPSTETGPLVGAGLKDMG
jgi:hypothetical protein